MTRSHQFNDSASLHEAATFFMNAAFRHIDDALTYDRALIIFNELSKKIGLPNGWNCPQLPWSLDNLLTFKNGVIPYKTAEDLAEAWQEAKDCAYNSDIRLPKTHRVSSIELAGHVIHLTGSVETVLNRFLFVSKSTGHLASEAFSSLDRTEILPKLLYTFKTEVASGKLDLARFKFLVKLRNRAVHFRAGSRDSLSPTIQDLLSTWSAVGELYSLAGGEPSQNEMFEAVEYILDGHINHRGKKEPQSG